MITKNRSLFILIALLVMTVSLGSSDKIRSGALALISPLLQLFSKTTSPHEQEVAQLKLENQLLMNRIEDQQALIKQESSLGETWEFKSLPAKVVFRPLNSWNSSLWIDAGEDDNKRLNRLAIAKNSPVVVGKAVVGVVDYVGNRQSKIRLITDASLNPYVRVKRGKYLLAKGELAGEGTPALRGRTQKLKGIGFNYDFADAEGPARDLRTGAPFKPDPAHPPMPLVQQQDLLITTGMDGIFPKGLEVGIIDSILPLKEGDYAYDIVAVPAAGNLNQLSVVFVLPPQYTE